MSLMRELLIILSIGAAVAVVSIGFSLTAVIGIPSVVSHLQGRDVVFHWGGGRRIWRGRER